MSQDIVARLHALIAKKPNANVGRLAQLARKLGSEDGPVEKAYAMQGTIRKLDGETQARLVSALESLPHEDVPEKKSEKAADAPAAESANAAT